MSVFRVCLSVFSKTLTLESLTERIGRAPTSGVSLGEIRHRLPSNFTIWEWSPKLAPLDIDSCLDALATELTDLESSFVSLIAQGADIELSIALLGEDADGVSLSSGLIGQLGRVGASVDITIRSESGELVSGL
jgi:Domain of unknown function (DUF4279)